MLLLERYTTWCMSTKRFLVGWIFVISIFSSFSLPSLTLLEAFVEIHYYIFQIFHHFPSGLSLHSTGRGVWGARKRVEICDILIGKNSRLFPFSLIVSLSCEWKKLNMAELGWVGRVWSERWGEKKWKEFQFSRTCVRSRGAKVKTLFHPCQKRKSGEMRKKSEGFLHPSIIKILWKMWVRMVAQLTHSRTSSSLPSVVSTLSRAHTQFSLIFLFFSTPCYHIFANGWI